MVGSHGDRVGIWPALTTILSKAGVTDFLTRYILSSVMDGLIYGGITLAALRIMSSRPDLAVER